MEKVEFFIEKPVKIDNSKRLKRFIVDIFKEENKLLSHITYVLTDDEGILALNKALLGHDYYTDVITLPLSNPQSSLIDAEAYISVERVKENATIYKSSFAKEMRRVFFHAALHLCGYDDKNDKSAKLIRQKEDYYLDKFLSSVSRETN